MASFGMDEHIPEEKIEELREAFSLFDKKGEGEIAISDLVETLKSLGQNPSQMEIDELVHEFDANGDGVIDFEEFKVLMIKKMKSTEGAEDIKDVFKCLDNYNLGYFTARDLHSVVVRLGENITKEEAEELVDESDTLERGKVSYEEFCHLVKNLIGRQ